MSDYSVSVDNGSLDRVTESVRQLENSMQSSVMAMQQMMAQQIAVSSQTMSISSGYMQNMSAVDQSFNQSMSNMTNTFAANAYASANYMAGGLQSLGYSAGTYGWSPPANLGIGGNTPMPQGGMMAGLWNMSGLGSQPINMTPTEYNQIGFDQATRGLTRGVLSAAGYAGSFALSAGISDMMYMAQGGSFKDSTLGSTLDVAKQLAGVAEDGLPGAWKLAKTMGSGAVNLAATMGPMMAVGMIGAGLGGALYQGMQTNWDIQDDLQKSSFRYYRGNQGRGFDRSQRQDIAKDIMEMGISEMTSGGEFGSEDLQKLMKMPQFSSYMSGTQDVDDFKKRFKGLVDSVKEVAVALNENFEHASQTVMELKRMGIGEPGKVAQTAEMIRGASLATGFTTQEVTGFVSNVGSMFKGTSISQSIAAPIVTQSMSMLQAARHEGSIDPAIIANMGGIQGLTQQVTGTVANLATNDTIIKSLFQQAFDTKTGKLDKGIIDNFIMGKQSALETEVAGAANVVNPADLVKFQRAFPKLLQEAGEDLVPLVFSRAKQMAKMTSATMGISEEDAMFQTFRQMTGNNDAMAQTFMGMYNSGAEGAMDMMMVQREAGRRSRELSDYEKNSIGGRLGRGWERMKHSVAQPAIALSNWVDDTLQDVNDSLAGVTRYKPVASESNKESMEYWYNRISTRNANDVRNSSITEKALDQSIQNYVVKVDSTTMREYGSIDDVIIPNTARAASASLKKVDSVLEAAKWASTPDGAAADGTVDRAVDIVKKVTNYVVDGVQKFERKVDQSLSRASATQSTVGDPFGAGVLTPYKTGSSIEVTRSGQYGSIVERYSNEREVPGAYEEKMTSLVHGGTQDIARTAKSAGYVYSTSMSRYQLRNELFASTTGNINPYSEAAGLDTDTVIQRAFGSTSSAAAKAFKSSIEAVSKYSADASDDNKENIVSNAANAYMLIVGAQNRGKYTDPYTTQSYFRQALINSGMSEENINSIASIVDPGREERLANRNKLSTRFEREDPFMKTLYREMFDKDERDISTSLYESTGKGIGYSMQDAFLSSAGHALGGFESAALQTYEEVAASTLKQGFSSNIANAAGKTAYRQAGGLMTGAGAWAGVKGVMRGTLWGIAGHMATDYATNAFGLSETVEYGMHGAVEGALLGSYLGPWGTAIGAIAGAGIGVVGNKMGYWGRQYEDINLSEIQMNENPFLNRIGYQASQKYIESNEYNVDRQRIQAMVEAENSRKPAGSRMTAQQIEVEVNNRQREYRDEVSEGAQRSALNTKLSNAASMASGTELNETQQAYADWLGASDMDKEVIAATIRSEGTDAAVDVIKSGRNLSISMGKQKWTQALTNEQYAAMSNEEREQRVAEKVKNGMDRGEAFKQVEEEAIQYAAQLNEAQRTGGKVSWSDSNGMNVNMDYAQLRQVKWDWMQKNAGANGDLWGTSQQALGYTGSLDGKTVQVPGSNDIAGSLVKDIFNKQLTKDEKADVRAIDTSRLSGGTKMDISEARGVVDSIRKSLDNQYTNIGSERIKDNQKKINDIVMDVLMEMETTDDPKLTVGNAVDKHLKRRGLQGDSQLRTDVLAILSGTALTKSGDERIKRDARFKKDIGTLRRETEFATKGTYKNVRGNLDKRGIKTGYTESETRGVKYGDSVSIYMPGGMFSEKEYYGSMSRDDFNRVEEGNLYNITYKDKKGVTQRRFFATKEEADKFGKTVGAESSLYTGMIIEDGGGSINRDNIDKLGTATSIIHSENFNEKAVEYLSAFKDSATADSASAYYKGTTGASFTSAMKGIMQDVKTGAYNAKTAGTYGAPVMAAADSYKALLADADALTKVKGGSSISKEDFKRKLTSKYGANANDSIEAITADVFGKNDTMGTKAAFEKMADSDSFASLQHAKIVSQSTVEKDEQTKQDGNKKSVEEINAMTNWAESMTKMSQAIGKLHTQVVGG